MSKSLLEYSRASLILSVTLLFSLVIYQPAFAACKKDLRGEVYCGAGACLHERDGTILCSRFKDGDAEHTKFGNVVCGKGQCVKTMTGQIYCSSVEGGSAVIDLHGKARCYGECELASRKNCENKIAGIGGLGWQHSNRTNLQNQPKSNTDNNVCPNDICPQITDD